MKKLIIFCAFLFLAVGCDKTYVYREPNATEVNNFIPFGYKLVSYNENLPGQTLKANLDSDPDKEIVLPMQAEDGESPIKIFVIKFDAKTNQWNLLKSLEYKDYIGITIIENPTDLNNDGINEVHFALEPYSATAGVNGHTILVLTNRNGELVNLMPQNSFYTYSQDGNDYKTASFIWGENEAHFDCHFFSVQTYVFNGSVYNRSNDYTTKYKYNNDQSNGNCVAFNIYKNQP